MPDGAIVLDTSLLVLLVVGLTSTDCIGRHKKLKAYSTSDYVLLEQLLSTASEIILTAHTLAETSNLIRYIGEPDRTLISHRFRDVILRAEENRIASALATENEEFIRLGLTDAVLMEALKTHRRLATADIDLYLAALKLGYDAINFNHLREASFS